MSERELAAILAAPDDDDKHAVDPADGRRPRSRDADEDAAEGDDEPLSPEDLVAEAVRQDQEAAGEDDEDEDDEDEDDEDDEDDLGLLREKSRQFDLLQQQMAQDQAQFAQRQLDGEYQQRLTQARAHYLREEQRIVSQIWSDSEQTPDPAAYRRMHLDAAIAGVRQQEAMWVGQIEADYRGRAELLFHERNKPYFADDLMVRFGLPIDPRVKADLLRVSDIRRMPERADELRRMHQQFQEMARLASQGIREERAKAVKLTQPHPNATSNRPARRKPVQYTGSTAELRVIEALR